MPDVTTLLFDVGGCVFVDDWPLNLECADRARINTIHFVDAAQLRSARRAHSVDYRPKEHPWTSA